MQAPPLGRVPVKVSATVPPPVRAVWSAARVSEIFAGWMLALAGKSSPYCTVTALCKGVIFPGRTKIANGYLQSKELLYTGDVAISW